MIVKNICPNCSGALNYDAESGELKCAQCSSVIDIPDTKVLNIKEPYTQNSTIKKSKTKYEQYKCNSCGRIHVSPLGVTLNNCPTCGDNNFTKTVDVEFMPNGIIPFRLNKEKALERFRAWLKTKKFAPNNLKKLAKTQSIIEKYVPVYSYDFQSFSRYSGTKEYTEHRGKETITRRTGFSGSETFDYYNYLECASNDLPSNDLQAINNYDFNSIMAYRTEYIYGLIASKLTEDLHKSCLDMQERARSEISSRIRNSISGNVVSFSCSTTFNYINYNYLYLPVFTSTYKYKKKNYTCYINGQTGKTHGKAPVSVWKVLGCVLLGALVIGAIVYFAMTQG